METLVYEDSPLADYLEGTALIFKRQLQTQLTMLQTGEGERDQEWTPQQVTTEEHSQNFAPKGVPSLQDRIRHKFATLSDNSSQETGTSALGRIHHTCSVCLTHVPFLW